MGNDRFQCFYIFISSLSINNHEYSKALTQYGCACCHCCRCHCIVRYDVLTSTTCRISSYSLYIYLFVFHSWFVISVTALTMTILWVLLLRNWNFWQFNSKQQPLLVNERNNNKLRISANGFCLFMLFCGFLLLGRGFPVISISHTWWSASFFCVYSKWHYIFMKWICERACGRACACQIKSIRFKLVSVEHTVKSHVI